MKKLIFFITLFLLFSCNKKENQNYTANYQAEVKELLLVHQADLVKNLNVFDSLAKNDFQIEKLKKAFLESRLAFKKTEPVIAHYFPENNKRLNGAAIPFNSIYDNTYRVIEPTGFQVVEELLFSEEIDTLILQSEIYKLKTLSAALENKLNYMQFNDTSLFEAYRLQVLRIISLGLSGFDSPVAFYSLPEAVSALEGLKSYLEIYSKDNNELNTAFKNAIDFIKNSDDFNSFDRYKFIKEHEKALSKTIKEIQEETNIPYSKFRTVIDFKKESFATENMFNPIYFSPPRVEKADSNQVALGEKLFFDPILSGNGQVSCATCHIPEQGYADRKRKVFENTKLEVNRNAPTLLTAAYQNSYFHDGRIPFLEDQAKSVINNKDEMHGSFDEAIVRLSENEEYKTFFNQNFEDGITEKNFLYVMASFIRDLPSFSSKFDNALRGKTALNDSEINGFNLFMGKAKCAICHFYPVFNGSVPPLYQETESEVIGVPAQKDTINAVVDPDLGVYYVHGAPLKKFAFKTPTVRNAALTFPYMHNGVYDSLEEVIDFYNRGGGAGIGIELDNQTLPFDHLNLNENEIKDLIAFIETLNDNLGAY
ncbi:cytochrome-c peroxidase [Flavobacteriaceae bacterium R38]|nr:cytochrome-c peroxidase [Flavobacteriaceae bacterium R38]